MVAAILYNLYESMKTMLINVDVSDDIITIRDRINWSNSQRILLIIPRKMKNFPDEMGLNLLNRAATQNGAKLGLITRQRRVKEFAEHIGVSVFPSITQAERASWRDPSKKESEKNKHDLNSIINLRSEITRETVALSVEPPVKRVLLSGLIILITIGVLIWIPTATVIIYPETQNQEQELEIHASTEVSQHTLTGMLPAERISMTLTGEMSKMSGGSVKVAKNKAKGEVVVTNLTIQPLVLPSGSVFSTGQPLQVKFVSLDEVELPGDGSAVNIKIEALNAGEAGNVGPGEIVILEGINGASVVVNNKEELEGGSSVTLPAPDDEDYNQLFGKLVNDLQEQAVQQSLTNTSETRLPIPESIILDEIVDQTRMNPIGEPSDNLTLNITAKFSILFYDPGALKTLMNDVMDVSIPAGYTAVEDDMWFEQKVEPVIIGQDEAIWQVYAFRPIYKAYNTQKLKEMINGITVNRAIDLINSAIPNYKSIEMNPFISWWPITPVLPNRIKIEERFTNGG